jgi:hypothetical protein
MMPAHIASGHNHYSIALHLGSTDHRLADAIKRFIEHAAAAR